MFCNKTKKINIESTSFIDRLYSCRDLEISNLWQRSVFLGAFLIVIYSGYGMAVFKGIEIFSKYDFRSFIQFNCLLLFVAFVGIIFSILWIFMSKGSKAWYEIYGDAIANYEEMYHNSGSIDDEKIEKFGMGKNYYRIGKRDDSILSTKGGAFSVSKVNILIGQLSFFICSIMSLCHILLIILYIFKGNYIKELLCSTDILIYISSACAIVFFILGCFFVCRQARSSYLYQNEYTPFLKENNRKNNQIIYKTLKRNRKRKNKSQKEKESIKGILNTIHNDMNKEMKAEIKSILE